jgi:hypothetical protein
MTFAGFVRIAWVWHLPDRHIAGPYIPFTRVCLASTIPLYVEQCLSGQGPECVQLILPTRSGEGTQCRTANSSMSTLYTPVEVAEATYRARRALRFVNDVGDR